MSLRPPPAFGTSSCVWPTSPPGSLPEVAALYLQHRLVLALRSTSEEATTASSVSHATGIPYKTCQRHLAGTQPLALEHLLVWRVVYGLEVSALLPRDLPSLVPLPYRERVDSTDPGHRRPPAFFEEPGEPPWSTVASLLLSRLEQARLAGAPHLFTAAAAASETAIALVAEGTPAGFVTMDHSDALHVDLRPPFDVHLVVGTERRDAATMAVRALEALRKPASIVICLLGNDARAALAQAAPGLSLSQPGKFGAVRLQDFEAAGLHDPSDNDLSVYTAALATNGQDRCLIFRAKA